MKTISLSKKIFDSLPYLELGEDVCNWESDIFDYTYKGKPKVLKVLHENFGRQFANKLYTVEMLNANKEYLPDSFVMPDYLVSVRNETIGFTVPKIDGITFACILANPQIDIKDKIDYLRKIGGVLVQLSKIREYTDNDDIKNFYINDIHSSNFMVNPRNREIYVIDLDSCKIAQNEAVISLYMTRDSLINTNPNKYEVNKNRLSSGYIIPSEETDLYCYIMMIISFLYGKNVSKLSIVDYYEYLNYLVSIGMDQKLVDIFFNVLSDKPNENPLNLLETITDEQAKKAKALVYEPLKKM